MHDVYLRKDLSLSQLGRAVEVGALLVRMLMKILVHLQECAICPNSGCKRCAPVDERRSAGGYLRLHAHG